MLHNFVKENLLGKQTAGFCQLYEDVIALEVDLGILWCPIANCSWVSLKKASVGRPFKAKMLKMIQMLCMNIFSGECKCAGPKYYDVIL